MRNRSLSALSLCLLLIFTACNKAGKTGLLIPKDAGMVLHLNLSSLSSKLSWKEIQQTAWYAEAQKQSTDSLAKKLLADPSSSGIDMDGSLVMFMKRQGNKGYLAFEGNLKNVEQFKNTIHQAGEGKVTIGKEGHLNYALMENNENGVLYFNDKLFVFIADASDPKGISQNKSIPQWGAPQSYPLDSLKHFAKTTFSLQGSSLLDNDKRFADLIAEKADIHYWINSGSLYGGMMAGPLAMMKIGDVLADNITMGTASFESGRIVAEGRQFYGKKLADLFKKYGGKELSADVLARLPEGDVLAAFAMNYNPEGIKEFLKLLGVDGMANAALGQLGVNFTLDDFVNANAGELAFALTGFSIVEKPSAITIEGDNGPQVIPYTDKKPEMKYVFGVSVNDRASFQKLIEAVQVLKSSGMSALQTDSTGARQMSKMQDKWFALGSSEAEADAFLTGNKKPSYASAFSGHNGGGFVDLQKLITAAAAGSKDTASKKAFDVSTAFWKDMNMYWDVKGGTATSHFEINLADHKTNALKQLNKYIDEMYKAIPPETAEFE